MLITLGTERNLTKLWIQKKRSEVTRKSNHPPAPLLQKQAMWQRNSSHWLQVTSRSPEAVGKQWWYWQHRWSQSRLGSSYRLSSTKLILWAQLENACGKLNERLFLMKIGSCWQVQWFWRVSLWENMQTALTRFSSAFICLCLHNSLD